MKIFMNFLRSLFLLGLFCAPVSATINILMKLAVLLALVTPAWRQHWRRIMRWPLSWCIVAVLAWMLLNMIGSAASVHYRHKIFLHYASFLLICSFAPVLFIQAIWRRALLYCLIASAVVLALNYWLAVGSFAVSLAHTAPHLHTKLSHIALAHSQELSVLFALGAYLSLLQLCFMVFPQRREAMSQSAALKQARPVRQALHGEKLQARWPLRSLASWSLKASCVWWGLLALLCAYVLLQVQAERVGVVVLIALLIVLPWQIFSKKTAGVACLVVLVALIGLSLTPGVQEKSMRTYHGVQQFVQHGTQTSSGIRLTGLRKAWQLWLHSPWRGYGTGTFSSGFDQQMPAQLGMIVENNYIGLLAQQGVIGLLLWLVMLVAMWLQLKAYPLYEKTVGRGVLLAVVIAANSYPAFLVNNSMAWCVAALAACYGSGLKAIADRE